MAEAPTKKEKRAVVYRHPNPVYRKSTMRKMSPVTRSVAQLIGEATSVVRRLKAMLPEISALEEKDMARREEMEKVLNRMTEQKES
jgi:hypothetical protein